MGVVSMEKRLMKNKLGLGHVCDEPPTPPPQPVNPGLIAYKGILSVMS